MVVGPEKTLEPEGPNADAMFDEPPPQDHDFGEQVEIEAEDHADKPTSLVRIDDGPSSPVKAADIPSTPMKAVADKEDDVIITGVGHTSPGNLVALSKHSVKEERSAMGKGKWSTDLSSYAHLNAQELHSAFLNHLYTNRDYEAGLVNLMKERYEVIT